MAQFLVERFDLAERAERRRSEFGVQTAWQAYVQVRLGYCSQMVSDEDLLRQNRWPHNLALLEVVRRQGCIAALATMSRREMARRVLRALDLEGAFAFVATRDDVERGKPDPEIYHRVGFQLGVDNRRCLH